MVGAILRSSGSIPVTRNPNNTPVPTEQPGGAGPAASQSVVNEALFRETFKALDREEVIGVFPEGSSHSEPSLARVKDGASRAALEYVKWAGERKGKQEKKLLVVPVGIVYTDKTQYQSRVSDSGLAFLAAVLWQGLMLTSHAGLCAVSWHEYLPACVRLTARQVGQAH